MLVFSKGVVASRDDARFQDFETAVASREKSFDYIHIAGFCSRALPFLGVCFLCSCSLNSGFVFVCCLFFFFFFFYRCHCCSNVGGFISGWLSVPLGRTFCRFPQARGSVARHAPVLCCQYRACVKALVFVLEQRNPCRNSLASRDSVVVCCSGLFVLLVRPWCNGGWAGTSIVCTSYLGSLACMAGLFTFSVQ